MKNNVVLIDKKDEHVEIKVISKIEKDSENVDY